MGMPARVKIACLIGFLATGMAALLLAVSVVSPGDRSDFFWIRVGWSEFLSMLVWGYVGWAFLSVVFARDNRQTVGGALPVYGLLVFLYSALSLTLMIAFAWFPMGGIHFVLQVILAALSMGASVFVYLAGAGHRAGMQGSSTGAIT